MEICEGELSCSKVDEIFEEGYHKICKVEDVSRFNSLRIPRYLHGERVGEEPLTIILFLFLFLFLFRYFFTAYPAKYNGRRHEADFSASGL